MKARVLFALCAILFSFGIATGLSLTTANNSISKTVKTEIVTTDTREYIEIKRYVNKNISTINLYTLPEVTVTNKKPIKLPKKVPIEEDRRIFILDVIQNNVKPLSVNKLEKPDVLNEMNKQLIEIIIEKSREIDVLTQEILNLSDAIRYSIKDYIEIHPEYLKINNYLLNTINWKKQENLDISKQIVGFDLKIEYLPDTDIVKVSDNVVIDLKLKSIRYVENQQTINHPL